MNKEVDNLANEKKVKLDSAKKRVITSKTKNLRNRMFKSAFKTLIKKYETTVAGGDKEEIPEEDAEKIWIDSFKAQLLRYHCSRIPLSWELFDDGRSIIRYASAYDDIFACGFAQ